MTDTVAPPRPPLASYRTDVHSQYGEDGVIAEILERIRGAVPLDGWCVEFGAWDGVYLSNTCHLIRSKGYRAVLIEGSPEKHAELCRNHPSDDVIKVCRFVTLDGESTLDRVLDATPVPAGFDFLSIDIDGCDYHVLESLKGHRPKVICVEFNPTIPNEVEFVQPRDLSVQRGSSARSMVKLAASMGYSLVAVTDCNLFLVEGSLVKAVVGDDAPSLEHLRDDSGARCFVFCGYDGTLLTSVPVRLPWHGLQADAGDLQLLPRFLRSYLPEYGAAQRAGFRLLHVLRFERARLRRWAAALPWASRRN